MDPIFACVGLALAFAVALGWNEPRERLRVRRARELAWRREITRAMEALND